MNTWIEGPPPRPKNRGCFPTGCLLLVALLVVLLVAFLAGGLLGMRYFIASARIEEVPQTPLSAEEQQEIDERWNEFDKRAQNGEPARADFTVVEFHHLVARHRKEHGYLAIANSSGHVRFHIPLGRIGFAGRQLNIASWLDELAQRYPITRFSTDNDRITIEANGGAAAVPSPVPLRTPEPVLTPSGEGEASPSSNPDALTTVTPHAP